MSDLWREKVNKPYKYRIPMWTIELAVAISLAFAIVATMTAIVAHGQEGKATFTDRNGNFSGSSITHGNKTDFYDGRGRYQGTATQQGTASNPLKGVDGSNPFGRRR